MFVLLGIGAVVLLVVLAINPLVKKLLADRIATRLIGNFSYSYDQLSVNLLDRAVTFEHVTWKFPRDTTISNQKGSVERFRISGISVISLLSGKHFRIKEIRFDSLVMVTRMHLPAKGDSTQVSPDLKAFNFYDLIKGQIKSLKVKKIVINDGNATWLNSNTDQVWRAFDHMQVEIHSIALDSALAATHNGWFTLRNARLEGENGIFFLPDSLHRIRLGKFVVDYREKRISIDSFQVVPLFTKAEMYDQVRYETDRLEINVPKIQISGIDLGKLIYEDKLRIAHIGIEEMNLEAFKDKHSPEWHSRYIRLPQVALQQASLNIKIDSLTVSNALIRSEQLSSLTHKKGFVIFTELQAAFSNITNDSVSCLEKPHATLKASAKLMGECKLDVDFTFNLLSSNGDHWFKGRLAPFDLTHLNSAMVPISAVSVRSGYSDKLEFDVRLNNEVSDGKMTFLYSNLKIDMLNKDQLKSKDFDNSLKSMLANSFLLKQSNPSGKDDPRIGIIHFRRFTDKTIFHFWWRSVLEGMKSTTLNSEKSN